MSITHRPALRLGLQALAQSSLISSVIHVSRWISLRELELLTTSPTQAAGILIRTCISDLSLVYKASERLTFDVTAFAAYQAQPDVTSALSANRRLGNFFRSEDNISAHYRWTPRFSTVTSYTFSALEYQNSIASSNDRLENQLGEQVRYLLFPTTTATAGYRIGITDYQTTGNNPISQTLTAGLDQTFGPHLRGIFQGGLQLRSGQTSPYFDAGLHYSFTSADVIWTNRYSIEESGTGAGSGRETFRTNLLLNYRVTARISANLAVSYQNGTGAQGADTGFNGGVAGGAENVFDVSPGVRYAITSSLAVNAGYSHTESGSRFHISHCLTVARLHSKSIFRRAHLHILELAPITSFPSEDIVALVSQEKLRRFVATDPDRLDVRLDDSAMSPCIAETGVKRQRDS